MVRKGCGNSVRELLGRWRINLGRKYLIVQWTEFACHEGVDCSRVIASRHDIPSSGEDDKNVRKVSFSLPVPVPNHGIGVSD